MGGKHKRRKGGGDTRVADGSTFTGAVVVFKPKLEVTMTTPMKVAPIQHEMMLEYARQCDAEISGFGNTEGTSRDPIFNEIHPLIKQVCSGGSTDLNEEMLFQLADSGRPHNSWWHSHHKNGMFWSRQDEEAIAFQLRLKALASMVKYGVEVPTPFYSIVVNQKREMKARCDIDMGNYQLTFNYNAVVCDWTGLLTNTTRRLISEEIDRLVTIPKYNPQVQVHTLPASNSKRPEGWNKESGETLDQYMKRVFPERHKPTITKEEVVPSEDKTLEFKFGDSLT